MEKTPKENRGFYAGVKNSFILVLPVSAVLYVFVNSESDRMRTTLIILSLFIAIELFSNTNQKRGKEYAIFFCRDFLAGVSFSLSRFG